MEEMVTDGSSDVPNSNSAEPQPPGTATVNIDTDTTVNIDNHTDVIAEFSKFEAFDPASCSWRTYAERLQNHFELYDLSNDKRVRIIIDRIGNATYEKLRKLCEPDNPVNKTPDELFELLSSHFNPPANKYKERVKFLRRVQRPQESMQEYVDELRKAAKSCEFPPYWLSQALRTQFTHGVRNDFVRTKLYGMEDMDFDKVLAFAISVELMQPPPPAPKKENPTPVNAPKLAKVAKKAPAAPEPTMTAPTAARKRVKGKKPIMNTPKFKTPFYSQNKPQFVNKNPPWRDFDDGYSSNQFGSQYRNNYSNSNSGPRLISSTYKPNSSLFY